MPGVEMEVTRARPRREGDAMAGVVVVNVNGVWLEHECSHRHDFYQEAEACAVATAKRIAPWYEEGA